MSVRQSHPEPSLRARPKALCAERAGAKRSPALRRWLTRTELVALGLYAGACGCTRLTLPTLSLHAVVVLHDGAKSDQQERGRDVAVQARLLFRARTSRQPMLLFDSATSYASTLPMLQNCPHTLLCEWAELSEESALMALGITP